MYSTITHEMFFERVTLIIRIISLSTMPIIDNTLTVWLAHCMAWLVWLVGNQAFCLKKKNKNNVKGKQKCCKIYNILSNRKYLTNQQLFKLCRWIISFIYTVYRYCCGFLMLKRMHKIKNAMCTFHFYHFSLSCSR